MKLKRIVSAAIAAALALALTVPVMAEGMSETIEGEGYIGWGQQYEERTPAPTVDSVSAGDIKVGGDNTLANYDPEGSDKFDATVHMLNVPKAKITVTWPDETTSQTTVKLDGSWQVNVPAAITLAAGDILYVTQKESDKATSYPVRVVVDGDDEIDPPIVIEPPYELENPENYLVLSLPSAFYWYVNQETYPDIVSGAEYEIITEGLVIPADDPADEKTFHPSVEVTLARFEQTNADEVDVEDLIELYFDSSTDFGVEISSQIQDGVTDKVIGTIQSSVDNSTKDRVTFAFTGEFVDGEDFPHEEGLVPQYEMQLHFAINDYDDIDFTA